MNPEDMTVDELDAISVGLKAEIEVLRDRRRMYKVVRDEKVLRESLERKLSTEGHKASTAGLTLAQVKDLLGIAEQTPPGEDDIVITPEPAVMDLGGKAAKVVASND